MKRQWTAFFAVLGAAVVLSGCEGTRELRAQMNNVRSQSESKASVLKKQNELLNRKLNDMNARVQELQESNDRLATELSSYITRPEEVKLEIITEVNTRFAGIAQQQDNFQTELTEAFTTKTAEIEQNLDSQLEEIGNTLEQHSNFVQFVSAEQDSINRVFANRFDSRPWYQSFMGKWDDMNRNREATP